MLSRTALLLVFVALPLGTAPLEIATGLALAGALLLRGRRLLASPLLGPVLAVAASWLLAALGHGADDAVEALGRTWPLALALAVPALAEDDPLVEKVGLAVAGAVALLAAGQVIAAGVPPWTQPATGLFSHHLTLGYALLPPLSRAWQTRRYPLSALLVLGVLCAGSSGPALALVVVLAARWLRPGWSLAGGLVAALALITLLRADPELHERAVLWSTGAALATTYPLGTGPLGFRAPASAVQQALDPGFYFPLHAHDAVLQIAALAGLGALIAWVWLGATVWGRADRAGKAALAGLLVGGLTQDTLGDLEVIRALLAWSLLPAVRRATAHGEPDPRSGVDSP